MQDQASTLRQMVSNMPHEFQTDPAIHMSAHDYVRATPRSRCIAITGGKGGIGKSNLTVNLAYELGALGKRVLLLDADFGLANADLLCGVTPVHHLGHVFTGEKNLEDVTISLTENVTLIPGGSGIEDLANISSSARDYIFGALQTMEENLDFTLIDTAAGIAENVLGVLLSAGEIILVATPEPTSIVDAYATIKVILRHAPNKPISLIVNNVVGVGDAEQVHHQLNYAATCFLDYNLEFFGMVPHDERLPEAVREQQPVSQYAPSCPASRAIRLIAKQLIQPNQQNAKLAANSPSFWENLFKQQ